MVISLPHPLSPSSAALSWPPGRHPGPAQSYPQTGSSVYLYWGICVWRELHGWFIGSVEQWVSACVQIVFYNLKSYFMWNFVLVIFSFNVTQILCHVSEHHSLKTRFWLAMEYSPVWTHYDVSDLSPGSSICLVAGAWLHGKWPSPGHPLAALSIKNSSFVAFFKKIYFFYWCLWIYVEMHRSSV